MGSSGAASGGAAFVVDLADVDLTGLDNGEILIWNSVDAEWQPGPASGSFTGDAGDVPFTPAGTIAATDTQAAIEEASGDLTTHAAAADPHAGYVLESLVDVKGDIIAATAANAVDRLAAGANGTVLTAASGQATGLQWVAPASVDIAANPIWAAKGDLAVGTAADTAEVLTAGANGAILEAASGETTGLTWGTAPVKLATLTTKGDLYVATGSAAVDRQAAGTNYFALTADSTVANGVAYKDVRALPYQLNAQTGTTYTLVIGDAGKLVTLSNASAITLTIPANASVAYPIGTQIDLEQLGAGQVTIAITSDTLVSPASLKTRSQYSMLSLVKTAATTWVLTGDLEPLGQLINAQSGTTYTGVLADANKLITMTNASASTFTIPANASVAYPIGTHLDLVQMGAGQVTVAITSDTLSGTPTLKCRAQYSAVTAIKLTATTWVLVGDLAAS